MMITKYRGLFPFLNRKKLDYSGGAIAIISWLLALCFYDKFLHVSHEQSRWLILQLPVILLFTISFSGLALWMGSALKAGDGSTFTSCVRFSRRIQWLHAVVVLSYGLVFFFPAVSGVLYFLVSPAVWAWSVSVWFSKPNQPRTRWEKRPHFIAGTAVFIGFTIFHTLTGLYYTESVGEHSGDEGHYLIQARSLYEDGDLDIRNQFQDPESVTKAQVHISPMALHGKWYSWHPPGLSFLLAPVTGQGLWVRHLLLGAISGWSLAGCFLVACTLGAKQRHALLVTLLLGGGVFWGVYASRALPEVLGAGLTIWGLYWVLKQRRWPWLSMLPIWGCIGFLPWVQTRFIPVAVVLTGSYGLEILMVSEVPWLRKIKRGTVFTLGAAGVLLFHTVMQYRFFENGMSYPVPKLLFSLPAGLWHSLASSRGIVFMFPLFACGLAAALQSLATRKHLLPALYSILLFLSVWLSSCATTWFTGGACLPGRFLLVVTPVLMVWIAVTLNPQRKAPFYVVLFTGLYGMVFFAAQLSILPEFSKSFTNPLALTLIHPLFPSLFHFDYDPMTGRGPGPAVWLYAGILTLFFMKRWSTPLVDRGIVAMIGIAYAFNMNFSSPVSESPYQTGLWLERLRLDKFYLVLNLSSKNEPHSFFEISDRFQDRPGNPVKNVTTEDLGERTQNKWISTPYLPVNDWEGRPLAWATLVPPFPSGRGKWAFLLEADLQSDSGAELAFREGGITHKVVSYPPGARISNVYTMETRGRGDLYVVIRFLGGEAEWTTHRLAATRYSDRILSTINATLDVEP
jgi:hypothetical protein